MTLKEKFNSIDQSRITADQKSMLGKMQDVTKDFTLENKAVNDKVEGALDKMIASFKEKMPDAIKTTTKTVVPKTSKSKKTTKVVSKTTTPKRTVMSVAKEIRKEGESWADAQKRAKAMIKEDKADVSEVVKTELDRIKKFISGRKELQGISGTDIPRDSTRQAKPRGRRISKDGNVYYENRENRTDRLAPNYPKDAPFLEEGGYLTDPTFGTFQNQVLENGGDFQSGVYAKGGGFREKNGRKYDIGRNWTKDHNEFDKTEEHEVRYRKRKNKFELGGVMATDLAGHTGGGDAGLNAGMPLDSFSNTGYTGLVGETGAMSSGEMFENGGGLPSGAEQHYVNYYLGEGSAQGIFKKGGAIKNQYEGRTAENVWSNWTEKQRSHFLLDHSELLDKDRLENNLGYTRTVQKDKTFSQLTPMTKRVLEAHVETGQYKAGGMLNPKERYVLEIKGLTGLRKEAIENYISENNLSDNDVLNIVIGLGRKQLKRSDVASAVVGKKGNSFSKEVIQFAKDNKGMKLEEGGNIDAFTLRMVKGTAGNPDEAMSEPRSVQFVKGGAVSFRERRNKYLETLGVGESKVWDKIGAESGSEIRNNPKMLKSYAEGVEEMLQKKGVGKGSFDQEDYDFYTDENWHLFNEFLVWNNYYEPNMTKVEKAWRLKYSKDGKKSQYVSDPEVIALNSTKSESDKKYIPNADIESVTVKKAGKEVTYSGKDVLNGANILADGGGIEDKAYYFSKNNVVSVELKNGKSIKPANGYWVEKDATPIKKMETGGKFEKLAKSVAKNYEGKQVKPEYQKEYGKVYSKEEAKEVGNKVAGKVKASQKMKNGGEAKKTNRGGLMLLAKKIRKDGESWRDALKRAGQQLK